MLIAAPSWAPQGADLVANGTARACELGYVVVLAGARAGQLDGHHHLLAMRQFSGRLRAGAQVRCLEWRDPNPTSINRRDVSRDRLEAV